MIVSMDAYYVKLVYKMLEASYVDWILDSFLDSLYFLHVVLSIHYWFWILGKVLWMRKTSQSVLLTVTSVCTPQSYALFIILNYIFWPWPNSIQNIYRWSQLSWYFRFRNLCHKHHTVSIIVSWHSWLCISSSHSTVML